MDISENFVAFSEYMNFNTLFVLLEPKYVNQNVLLLEYVIPSLNSLMVDKKCPICAVLRWKSARF